MFVRWSILQVRKCARLVSVCHHDGMVVVVQMLRAIHVEMVAVGRPIHSHANNFNVLIVHSLRRQYKYTQIRFTRHTANNTNNNNKTTTNTCTYQQHEHLLTKEGAGPGHISVSSRDT